MKHREDLETLALRARSNANTIKIAALATDARWIADRAARLAADCDALLAELRALDSEPRMLGGERDGTTGEPIAKPELLGTVVKRMVEGVIALRCGACSHSIPVHSCACKLDACPCVRAMKARGSK